MAVLSKQPMALGHKAYSYEFEVQGHGYFPVDMLRYDSCHPATSEDASNIIVEVGRINDRGNYTKPRTVTLRHTGDFNWRPTDARWESFGWKVIHHYKTARR